MHLGSEHTELDSPRLVKHESGFPNPQRALIGSNQLWRANSLAPGNFEWNFRYVIFKRILVVDGWGTSCEIALIWMSLDFTDDQSTLVRVMAWCRQATSHYLNLCWSRSLPPYGVTRPQWVDGSPYYREYLVRSYYLSHRDPFTTLRPGYISLIHNYHCIKSSWSSYTIWQHRSRSTLALVMACFLTAHKAITWTTVYFAAKMLWHSLEITFIRIAHELNP